MVGEARLFLFEGERGWVGNGLNEARGSGQVKSEDKISYKYPASLSKLSYDIWTLS